MVTSEDTGGRIYPNPQIKAKSPASPETPLLGLKIYKTRSKGEVIPCHPPFQVQI